jgi:hypothetical protein
MNVFLCCRIATRRSVSHLCSTTHARALSLIHTIVWICTLDRQKRRLALESGSFNLKSQTFVDNFPEVSDTSGFYVCRVWLFSALECAKTLAGLADCLSLLHSPTIVHDGWSFNFLDVSPCVIICARSIALLLPSAGRTWCTFRLCNESKEILQNEPPILQ